MLLANFVIVCFIEWNYIADGSCALREFGMFDLSGSCDLDIDPMTFIYELNPYFLETYRMCESERPISKLSKVIVFRAANACV